MIEVITYPADCTNYAAYITKREAHWVAELAAVETGSNTVRPMIIVDQRQGEIFAGEA